MVSNGSPSEIVQRVLAQRGLSAQQIALAAAIGGVESGNGRANNNPRSTASGYFQFLNGTYDEMLASIRANDPATAREMERLGKDHPFSQAHAYAEYSTRTEQTLRQALGRDPTAVEMYAGHFFGAGGAARVLRAPGNTPVSSLVDANVMAANPHLNGMTVDGFRQYYERRLNTSTEVTQFVFTNPHLNPIERESQDAALAGLRASNRGEEADRLQRDLQGNNGALLSVALTNLQRIQQEVLREAGVETNERSLHLAQKFGAPAAIQISRNQDPNKRLSELGVAPEAYGAYQRESTRLLSDDAMRRLNLSDEQRTRLTTALGRNAGEATAEDLNVIATARGRLHEQDRARVQSRIGAHRGGRAATREEQAEEDAQRGLLNNFLGSAMNNPGMMLLMLLLMVAAPELAQSLFQGMGGPAQQGQGQPQQGQGETQPAAQPQAQPAATGPAAPARPAQPAGAPATPATTASTTPPQESASTAATPYRSRLGLEGSRMWEFLGNDADRRRHEDAILAALNAPLPALAPAPTQQRTSSLPGDSQQQFAALIEGEQLTRSLQVASVDGGDVVPGTGRASSPDVPFFGIG
jgi:hypothetical protein